MDEDGGDDAQAPPPRTLARAGDSSDDRDFTPFKVAVVALLSGILATILIPSCDAKAAPPPVTQPNVNHICNTRPQTVDVQKVRDAEHDESGGVVPGTLAGQGLKATEAMGSQTTG